MEICGRHFRILPYIEGSVLTLFCISLSTIPNILCLFYGWMHGWDMDGRDGREKWVNEKAKTGNEKPILFLSFKNSDN